LIYWLLKDILMSLEVDLKSYLEWSLLSVAVLSNYFAESLLNDLLIAILNSEVFLLCE